MSASYPDVSEMILSLLIRESSVVSREILVLKAEEREGTIIGQDKPYPCMVTS